MADMNGTVNGKAKLNWYRLLEALVLVLGLVGGIIAISATVKSNEARLVTIEEGQKQLKSEMRLENEKQNIKFENIIESLKEIKRRLGF